MSTSLSIPTPAPGVLPQPPVPPMNAIGATRVTLSWSHLPEINRNGIFYGYTLKLEALGIRTPNKKRSTETNSLQACLEYNNAEMNRLISSPGESTSLEVNNLGEWLDTI